MENPGLKRHISDASFLKVAYRRTANPIMPEPKTLTDEGYQDSINDLYQTTRENVETPPPLMGGSTSGMVPATNGENTPYRGTDLGGYRAGAPETQIPGEASQVFKPRPTTDVEDPNDAADQRRIDQQRQVGGGEKENPAYEQAQQNIRTRLQLRRAHPLHQGSIPSGGDSDLTSVDDPEHNEYLTGGRSMQSFGPACETCWLNDHVINVFPEGHEGGDYGHPYKPLEMEPGQRFSHVAAQVPHDDPIYPYNPQPHPELDTVDLDNLQSGDDSSRPNPGRANPMLDRINEVINSHPDGDEESERGGHALAEGMNTILDALKGGGTLEDAKRAIDTHLETGKLAYDDHVRRLQQDWEARGGRKTGEPKPVGKFSPRLTHPDGQYIVPDPNNIFPQSSATIRFKGKCKGCGTSTFATDDGSMSDPRGPLGDHTYDPMRASEFSPKGVQWDYDDPSTHMHGPDMPACLNCQNDSDRYHKLVDKGMGHKAGEKDGGFHWEWQRQPDGSQKNVRVDHTHFKDKKGLWHAPGEKPGSCPDCGPMQAEASWSRLLREAAAEDDPRAELNHLLNSLPEAGSPVQHTQPSKDDAYTLAEMGFGRDGGDDQPYWLRRDQDKDYFIQPGIEGYWESSSGPHDHWQDDLFMPTPHPTFIEAVEHMQVPPRPEPRRPGRMVEFGPGDYVKQTWSSRLATAQERDEDWA